jgi:transposase
MHAWMSSMVRHVSAKSTIARAIGYSLPRWRVLTRCLEDGRIEMRQQ